MTWPLILPPQWTWRTKTWTTSWTITDSVLYRCRLSPKHHHEVPKTKGEKWEKTPPGRQTSVILASILSSVLLKLLMTQHGTKTAHWLVDLDCVYSVYLTHLWSDCEWIALHRPLLCRLSTFRTRERLGGGGCLYFSEFLNKGYISKVALSRWIDEKQPLACLFTGEGYWSSLGRLREGTRAC